MKLFNTLQKIKMLSACLLALTLFHAPVALSASAAYLDALDAEAGTAPEKKGGDTAWSKTEAIDLGDADVSTQEGFENYLKASYFGSYVFYQKLSTPEKRSCHLGFIAPNLT